MIAKNFVFSGFQSLLRLFRARQTWLAIGLLLLFITYGVSTNPRIFSYDARYYWELRQSFDGPQGKFSLLSFSDERYELRGYMFPLFLLASEWLIDLFTPDRWVDDFTIVVILNSILIFTIGWGLLPAIFSRLAGRKSTTLFRLVFTVLLTFLWRGHLHYPLSDVPALFFLLAGLLLVIKVCQPPTGWHTIATAFLAGAMLMAVYIIRPVYLLVFMVTTVGLIVAPVAAIRWRQRLFSLFAFLLAGALVLTPQYLINRIHYGINSPFISGGLYSFQMTVGFLIQRFEANMDKTSYPSAGVRFVDPQAENLLAQEGRELPFVTRISAAFEVNDVLKNAFSFQDFIRFFQRYPLDIITIYFRHVFNGLNLMYPTTYIGNIYRPDLLLMWLNYTVLFGVLFFFDARPFFASNPRLSGLIFIAWLLPALTAIPGAVEARYFLPLHVLLEASFVWMLGDFKDLQGKIKQFGWLRTIVLYMIFVLLAFSLSGLIFTTVPNATLLLTPR